MLKFAVGSLLFLLILLRVACSAQNGCNIDLLLMYGKFASLFLTLAPIACVIDVSPFVFGFASSLFYTIRHALLWVYRAVSNRVIVVVF